MSRLASVRVCLLALACSASMASRAWPQIGFEPPDPVNPATYKSPSGVYALSIDPSDRYGRFAAKYRVTRSSNEVWSATLPFTFFRACITDAGDVGGYGYTRGEYGYGNDPRDSGPGDLVVAILDATGKAKCKQFVKREHCQGREINLYPLGTGLIVDEANDRLIVRVLDRRQEGPEEIWWTYRLSTGDLVEQISPGRSMPHETRPLHIFDARLVPGTPLVLVHWRARNNFELAAQFALLNSETNVVWSLTLPADYVVKGDNSAEHELGRWIWSHGALLRNDQHHRFDLLFAAESKRVTFTVEEQPAGGWKVAEIARAPFSIKPPTKPQIPTAPKRPLKYLGPLDLPKTKPGEASPIRNVRWFTFDDPGRIAFLREDDKQTSLVVVDQAGKVACEAPLTIQPQPGFSRWSGLCWVGGDRFVASVSETGVGGKARAWRIEPEQSRVEPIAAFDCPAIDRLVGSPDGRFVVLATRRFQSGAERSVAAFDSQGGRLWTLHEGREAKDPASLVSCADIAVTNDRQVVVLEKATSRLKFFDLGGRHRHTLDLEKAWNRMPRSPVEVVALAGGFLIAEEPCERFFGPCYVQMMRDGTIIGGFNPTYSNRDSVDPAWGIKPSPNGDFWLADGDSLMRIGHAGVIDRDLVESLKPGQPRRVSGMAIDRRGRIYAVDARTGTIYVFDDAGNLLHVYPTKPHDLESGTLPLATGENGEIFLGLNEDPGHRSRSFAHFSAAGARLKDQMWPSGTCCLQPGGKALVAKHDDNVELIDGSGKAIRTIDRRPDGHWLQYVEAIAFAPDGSMAILDRARDVSAKGYEADLSANLYKANGDPIRTVCLPESVGSAIAYDGRRLVVAGYGGLLLFDGTGGPLVSCDSPPQVAARYSCYPYLLPGGRVLALFDGKRPVLHRYELP